MHLLKASSILFLVVSAIGCDPPTHEQTVAKAEQVSKEAADNITYTKDKRTGLCFTVTHIAEYPIGSASVYNNVPCSAEVEALLGK